MTSQGPAQSPRTRPATPHPLLQMALRELQNLAQQQKIRSDDGSLIIHDNQVDICWKTLDFVRRLIQIRLVKEGSSAKLQIQAQIYRTIDDCLVASSHTYPAPRPVSTSSEVTELITLFYHKLKHHPID